MTQHDCKAPSYGAEGSPDRDALRQAIDARGFVCLVWYIEDVLEFRPELTRAQACNVLAEVVVTHDPANGVCWSTVEWIADDLYPQDETEGQS